MRRLILFRHAKAEARAPGGEDIDRGLTARGRRDAALIGGVLAKAGLTPDLALVSPAARTRQTWDCAQAALPGVAIQIRDGLYNAAPEEVEAELKAGTGGAATVIVVGHNPSLQELAVNLLDAADASPAHIEQLAAAFPTATAAAFTLGPDGRASLEALFHPRDGDGE